MSFWELFVIGVIALVVLGPERLPKAARTLGLWIGKAKQSFNTVKNEIDRELKVKELQQQLLEQKVAAEDNLKTENLQQELNSLSESIKSVGQSIDQMPNHLLKSDSTQKEPPTQSSSSSTASSNETTSGSTNSQSSYSKDTDNE